MILSRIRSPHDKLPPMIYLEKHDHEDKLKTPIFDNTTNSNSSEIRPSLFKLYNNAANKGLEGGLSSCGEEFGRKCHYSMDKLLNMPTLRFWTAMQRFLKLKFTDGSISF